MTEIKRLSDEDIKTLKMVHEEPVCTSCPIAGGICGNIIKKSECYLNCHAVANAAIRIEMEAREREKMEEKKQLPTESELRAEMQHVCDSVNAFCHQKMAFVCESEYGNNLSIRFISNGQTAKTDCYEFRPDIKPPAKYRAVFVRGKRSNPNLLYMVSSGKFDIDGRLAPLDKEVFKTDEWCDCLDRSHHSAGWDMAWLEG